MEGGLQAYGVSDKLEFLRWTFVVLVLQTFLACVLGLTLVLSAGELLEESTGLVLGCVVLVVLLLSGVLYVQDVARKGLVSVFLLLLLTSLQTSVVTYIFLNHQTFLVIGGLVSLFGVELALCVYVWTVFPTQTQEDFQPKVAYALSSGVAGSLGLVFVALAPTEQGLLVALAQAGVLGTGLYVVWASKKIVLEEVYVLREQDFVFAALLIYADPLRLLLLAVRRLVQCRLKPVAVSFALQSIGGPEFPHGALESARSETEFP